jgi:hypothetical protein
VCRELHPEEAVVVRRDSDSTTRPPSLLAGSPREGSGAPDRASLLRQGFLFGQLPAAPIESPTWLNLVEALFAKSVMAAMRT